jgi:hypothetical protein
MIIDDINALKSAASLLHDARFTAEAIVFEKSTRTFTLKCWQRDVHRSWRAYQLLIANVIESKVTVKEAVAYYELSTFRFDQRRLELITHYGIEISLEVEKLAGEVIDTGETQQDWAQLDTRAIIGE